MTRILRISRGAVLDTPKLAAYPCRPSFDPPCACFGVNFTPRHSTPRFSNEAHLPAQQSKTSTHAWFSCAYGNAFGPPGARSSPRQGPQAPHSLTHRSVRPRSQCYLQALTRPFTPAQRLHNKSDFDRVYKDARRFADALFAIFVRSNNGPQARLGLSIAARIIGGAVRRNHLKRLIRESFRHHQHELPAVDIVINARAGARNADNATIVRSLERHWRTVSERCASS